MASAALASVACGSEQGDPNPSGEGVAGTVTVFAAASLRDTFTEIGAAFEQAHDDAAVVFNFAGSSDLAGQLAQGAPADVFASADPVTMSRVVDEGLVAGEPVLFAANTLTIVTEPGNPKGITSFADLGRDGVSAVVCAPRVPCGAATVRAEEATGTELSPVSEESSVADVLAKVTSGQADAGLVYVTDARAAGDAVTVVAFPESGDSVNTYPIAVLEDSRNPDAARAFVDFVTGPEGLEILGESGFAGP